MAPCATSHQLASHARRRQRGTPLTLACIAVALQRCAAAPPPPYELIPDSITTITTGTGATTYFAQRAAFGRDPSSASYNAVLAPDDYHLGCNTALPTVPAATVYLVARGQCSFAYKAQAAAAAGASAVLIFNSPATAYLSPAGDGSINASYMVASRCGYDCSAGSALLPAADVNMLAALAGFPGRCGDGCPTRLCLLTAGDGPTAGTGLGVPRTACCAVEGLMVMGTNDTIATTLEGMEVAMVGITAGAALLTAAAAPSYQVATGLRPTPTMDPAGILLILLGSVAAAAASFFSAWPEREAIRALGKGDGAPPSPASSSQAAAEAGQPEPLTLTLAGGVAALGGAAAVLLGLFALIRMNFPIVYLILAVFFFASSSASAAVLFRPLIVRVYPPAEKAVLCRCSNRRGALRRQAVREAAEVLAGAAIVPVDGREIGSHAYSDGGEAGHTGGVPAPEVYAAGGTVRGMGAGGTSGATSLADARRSALPPPSNRDRDAHSDASDAFVAGGEAAGGMELRISVAAALSTFCGVAAASVYVAMRHAEWSWVLQVRRGRGLRNRSKGVCVCL